MSAGTPEAPGPCNSDQGRPHRPDSTSSHPQGAGRGTNLPARAQSADEPTRQRQRLRQPAVRACLRCESSSWVTGTTRSPSTRSAGNSASEPVTSRMVPPTAIPKTP
jgi:hypothetical protein